MDLDFYTDPAEFLAVAAEHLAAEPVISTVVATVADRAVVRLGAGMAPPNRDWWLVVRDDAGAVVGAGMRAAPSPPYPMFLLPMPDAAARSLAHALHDRGEEALGVNGALPSARVCAGELARLSGGSVTVGQHTRLHELTELTRPAPAPGRLVPATEDDLDLVVEWTEAFGGDADEQAGRPRQAHGHGVDDRSEIRRRISDGQYWFWATETGRRVHMTRANPPSYGVARIGPVYTPPAERGRGWASSAVAEVSGLILAGGARPCLFTDQANPTSNRIYAALGYRPIVDMANLVIAGRDS